MPLAPLTALLLFALAAAALRLRVVAQPDEWLLHIRDGRLLRTGVGVVAWRRPGDVVARFTSTLQRVRFEVQALSADGVEVALEGFLLWTVDPEGEGPFQAFRQLGIVNLEAGGEGLASAKHLLTTPQHRAFRQLLCAAAQRRAARQPLEALLHEQGALVAALGEELRGLEAELGIRIEQLEMIRVRPSDPEWLERLAAEGDATSRERARAARLESEERTRLRELASAARIAEQESAERERTMAREHAHALRAQALKAERAREARLAEAALAQELAEAERALAEQALVAELDQLRRRAEAERDAAMARAEAEQARSPELRAHERALRATEAVGQALGRLEGARWVSVGEGSPVASVAGLIQATLGALAEPPEA